MATALSHRGFRTLWIATILTYTSQWIQQVTLAWAAYQITGSLISVGMILGIRAIPMFLLAPFSGVAAERYNRRNLMLGGQALLCVATLVIGTLFALDAIKAWHLAAYVTVSGVAQVFDRNARHAIILDLVPRELAVSAVSLVGVAQSGARVLAPALAGALIAATGIATNFFLQSSAYFIVCFLLAAIRLPERVSSIAGVAALTALADGMRLAWTNRNLRVLVFTGVLPFMLVFGSWGTLFPAIVRDSFAAGAASLGLIMAGIGAGGLTGGLAMQFLGRFDRVGLAQNCSVLLLGCGVLGVSLSPSVPVAIAFAYLIGLGEMLHWSLNQTMVQLATPSAYRGRVTSLLAVYPAFISVGSFWTGLLGEALGARLANGLIGASALVIALATFVLAPRLATLRLSNLRPPSG